MCMYMYIYMHVYVGICSRLPSLGTTYDVIPLVSMCVFMKQLHRENHHDYIIIIIIIVSLLSSLSLSSSYVPNQSMS